MSAQDQSTLIPPRPGPFQEPCDSSRATFSAHPPAPFPVGKLLSGRPQEGRIGGNEKHPVLQVREPAGEAGDKHHIWAWGQLPPSQNVLTAGTERSFWRWSGRLPEATELRICDSGPLQVGKHQAIPYSQLL